MHITWAAEDIHSKLLALHIDGVFYGKWSEKWVKQLQILMRNNPNFHLDIVASIARFEEEVGSREALNLLSRRACFSSEIRRRLEAAGCSPTIADRILAKCRKAGYLDDEERARRMVETWKKRGYGPLRIRFELKKRAGAIALPQVEENGASDGLLRYIDKHLPAEPTEQQKAKVMRALLRRGFSLEAIYSELSTRSHCFVCKNVACDL